MPRPAALTTLRRRIDRIDDRLLALLNERAAVAVEVAASKAASGRRVYAPEREKSVLRRLLAANHGPLRAADVRAIFAEIISASRGMEAGLRVAYLGPEATYTHLAARTHFGQAATFVGADTIADVFRDVIIDICQSLIPHGARRFYVLNTGISTIAPLQAARASVTARGALFELTDIRTEYAPLRRGIETVPQPVPLDVAARQHREPAPAGVRSIG